MRYLIAVSLILIAVPVSAQGSIALTSPIVPPTPATISSYEPVSLTIRQAPAAEIAVEIRATTQPDLVLTFRYPYDCGSFGATMVNLVPVPNPPVCANLDTSAEVAALIGQLNTVNLSTRSLWRRIFDRLVADFPGRFPGGATVQ